MLATLQDRLARNAATVRDDEQELSWPEFLRLVEQSPIDTLQVLAPQNSVVDAARVFAGIIGRAPTVLLHAHDDKARETITRDKAVSNAGLYVFTSGSSGRAKLVRLSSDSARQHALAVNQHLRANEDDTWLACLPLFHVGGLAILMRAALAGASVRLTSAGDTKRLADIVDREPITLVSFVPTILRRVLAARQSNEFPPRVRAILVGGGASDAELVASIPQVLRTYGMTETGSMVTCVSLTGDAQERASSGQPIPGAAVRIVDEQFHGVAANVKGRIVVRGAGMATAYVNDETQTALTFREGWVVTEDEGYLDAFGNLHVIGRRDRIIVSGGENIALAEVEAALRLIPDVRDAICCGLDDPEWGQIIGAVLECDREIALDEVRGALKSSLPSFKLPRRVLCVSALPKLPSGKLDSISAAELLRD